MLSKYYAVVNALPHLLVYNSSLSLPLSISPHPGCPEEQPTSPISTSVTDVMPGTTLATTHTSSPRAAPLSSCTEHVHREACSNQPTIYPPMSQNHGNWAHCCSCTTPCQNCWQRAPHCHPLLRPQVACTACTCSTACKKALARETSLPAGLLACLPAPRAASRLVGTACRACSQPAAAACQHCLCAQAESMTQLCLGRQAYETRQHVLGSSKQLAAALRCILIAMLLAHHQHSLAPCSRLENSLAACGSGLGEQLPRQALSLLHKCSHVISPSACLHVVLYASLHACLLDCPPACSGNFRPLLESIVIQTSTRLVLLPKMPTQLADTVCKLTAPTLCCNKHHCQQST